MIDNISAFEGVLKKFRFAEPVPEDIRVHASAARTRILADILREKGDYSLLLRVSLRLFYLVRSVGMRITVIQSAVAISAASVISAGVIASGSYVAVKNIIHVKPRAVETEVVDKALNAHRMTEADETETRISGTGSLDRNKIRENAVSAGESVPSKSRVPGSVMMPGEGIIARNVNNRKMTVKSASASKQDKKSTSGKKEQVNEKSNQDGETVIPADGISAADVRDKDGTDREAEDKSDKNEKEPDKNKIIFFAGAGLSLNIPSGRLNSFASAGPSLELSFGIKNLFIKNFNPFLKAGYYVFPLKEDSGKYAAFTPVFLTAAYHYIFMEKYFISPEAAIGAALYKIDLIEQSKSGSALAGGAGAAAGYMFSRSINFTIGLRYYSVILKNERLGWLSIGAGAEKSF